MRYRRTVLMGILAASLLAPLTARSGAADEGKASGEKGQEGAPVRPLRQTLTPTTFSPAVVEFLRRPLATQLATLNPNGSPQLTIMWFQYEDGALLFTTTTDRVKFRNQQKDPRAALTVLDPANMYKWVIVNGTLSVDQRDPEAFYRGLAGHYLDEAGLAEWRKTAVMKGRTVLRLTPTRIKTMGFPSE